MSKKPYNGYFKKPKRIVRLKYIKIPVMGLDGLQIQYHRIYFEV